MNFIFRRIGFQFVFALILFSLIRVLFLGVYWKLFADLAVVEILFSLLWGVRFDLSVICKFFGLLNLLVLLPFAFCKHKYYFAFIALIGNLLILVFLVIQVIDLGYYSIVGRRISFELFTMGTALDSIIGMVMADHKLELFGGIFLVLLVSAVWWFCWAKLLTESVTEKKVRWIPTTLVFISFLLLMILGGRGGFQAKPIFESTAFRNSVVVLGHLSLNAPFTVMSHYGRDQIESIDWIAISEATATTRELFQELESSNFPETKYTFYRTSSSTHSKESSRKYNVVLIIMESWAAHSVGVLGAKYKDLTPEFDALARKGRLFTRFFANGTRSVEGVGACLMSIVALPQIAFITSSFEQNNMVSLPNLLHAQGYDSLFLHGAFKGSFGMHEFATRIGYKKVMSKEDFLNYEENSDGTWGIWDHLQFEKMIEEIDQMKKPFFTTMFSVSSHEPFVVPNPKFEHYPHTVPDHQWLNALRYSDWAIGQFFAVAQKKDWYENTLFVITSDHTLRGRADKPLDSARIPLLLYTPNGEIQQGIDARIGTQVDLVPTILDFLGIEEGHHSMGTSLIKTKNNDRFGLFNTGTTLWLTDQTAYQFSGKKLLGAYHFETDWNFNHNIKDESNREHQQQIKNYRAYLQSAQNALIFNSLAPP